MSELRDQLDQLGLRGKSRPRTTPMRTPKTVITDLATAVDGRTHTVNDVSCWRIDVPFHAVLPDCPLTAEQLGITRSIQTPSGLLTIDPKRSFIIDIETGGLWGTPVFLIGVIAIDDANMHVVQWLARDYPEESAILVHLADWIGTRDTWISFNGKSFDEPFVRERGLFHRLDITPTATHLDLLHASRRQWKHELPNCRLSTLETHILGRTRIGDVPSADVPDLFHHFFKTGNARPLRPVLEHNQIDLISCAELLVNLAEPHKSM